MKTTGLTGTPARTVSQINKVEGLLINALKSFEVLHGTTTLAGPAASLQGSLRQALKICEQERLEEDNRQ